MPITTQQLFDEPFTPAWMLKKQQTEVHEQLELDRVIKEATRQQWVAAHVRSHQDIVAKHRPPQKEPE